VNAHEGFCALREKYEAMLALREAHARAREEPSFIEPDPRATLSALARRFPGALREIDALPLETIRARIDALAALEADGRLLEPWMVAQVRFHTLTRGALAAKRWLGKRRDVDDATLARFDAGAPEGTEAWRNDLAALARPPRCRIHDVVFSRLAEELGVAVPVAKELVFGARP
jgi:hypothetical protein